MTADYPFSSHDPIAFIAEVLSSVAFRIGDLVRQATIACEYSIE
jgi:hypothetical protein